jgi:hypothetical protein
MPDLDLFPKAAETSAGPVDYTGRSQSSGLFGHAIPAIVADIQRCC